MTHFDEKSGVVPCTTKFGRWWQTVDEVFIEIDVPDAPISSKDVKCDIKNNEIKCAIKGNIILEGKLFRTIQSEESFWTLEEKKTIKILLLKANPGASNCWSALLANGQYEADAWTLDLMQKKLTLQRFQLENPGFDFSNAEVTGNYESGGPVLPM